MSHANATTCVLLAKPAKGRPRPGAESFQTMSTIRRRISHRASIARFMARNAARLVTGWI
jgi:hypothetical protein